MEQNKCYKIAFFGFHCAISKYTYYSTWHERLSHQAVRPEVGFVQSGGCMNNTDQHRCGYILHYLMSTALVCTLTTLVVWLTNYTNTPKNPSKEAESLRLLSQVISKPHQSYHHSTSRPPPWQLSQALSLLFAWPTHLSLASLDFVCKSSNMSICDTTSILIQRGAPRSNLQSVPQLNNLAAVTIQFYTLLPASKSLSFFLPRGVCLWQRGTGGLIWVRPKNESIKDLINCCEWQGADEVVGGWKSQLQKKSYTDSYVEVSSSSNKSSLELI